MRLLSLWTQEAAEAYQDVDGAELHVVFADDRGHTAFVQENGQARDTQELDALDGVAAYFASLGYRVDPDGWEQA